MHPLSLLLLASPIVSRSSYFGQHYGVTFEYPSSDHPWYTGGYNPLNVTTVQTLICCPPLPPVAWLLRNPDTSLLSSDLTIASTEGFDAPPAADVAGAKAGKGYVLSAVLATNHSQSFGDSTPFEIIDGAQSPPIWPSAKPSPSDQPGSTPSVDPNTPTGTTAPDGPPGGNAGSPASPNTTWPPGAEPHVSPTGSTVEGGAGPSNGPGRSNSTLDAGSASTSAAPQTPAGQTGGATRNGVAIAAVAAAAAVYLV